jgi:hypothetical protein
MAVAPLSSGGNLGRQWRCLLPISDLISKDFEGLAAFGHHVDSTSWVVCSRGNPRSGLPDLTMAVSGASLPLGASFSN